MSCFYVYHVSIGIYMFFFMNVGPGMISKISKKTSNNVQNSKQCLNCIQPCCRELTYTDQSTSTTSTPTTQPAAADTEADLSSLASCETYDVSLVPVYNGCKGTAATVEFTTSKLPYFTLYPPPTLQYL